VVGCGGIAGEDLAHAAVSSRAARAGSLLGEKHTTLAERYLEEGEIMDEHPNIHFVDAPSAVAPRSSEAVWTCGRSLRSRRKWWVRRGYRGVP